VVTDLRMPGADGFAILEAVRTRCPRTPVIVMSGSAQIPDAVRAMRLGARDFLVKPVGSTVWRRLSAAPLACPRLRRLTQSLTPWRGVTEPRPGCWRGSGHARGAQLARPGVGHELHRAAHRRIWHRQGIGGSINRRRLIARQEAVRGRELCRHPTNLVESELFGHAKGAFTGANSARMGRFAEASGGTILLDEIGEMETGVQAKLLRLIQDGVLRPVGDELDSGSTCAFWPPPTASSRTTSPLAASALTSLAPQCHPHRATRPARNVRPISRFWLSIS